MALEHTPYDSDGKGPFTKEEFHQYYNGSLREWAIATPEHVKAPPARAPTAPIAKMTHPPAQGEGTIESTAKAQRTHTTTPHSPGHLLANAAASLGIAEHGSLLPDALMPSAVKIVHGWNYPMPLPGQAPIGKRIEPHLLLAAAKLARGLHQLIAMSSAKSSDGQVMIDHKLIAEYLATPTDGAIDPDITTDLMINLETTDVVNVETHEPGAEHDTQYFYNFLIEPAPA